MKQKPTTITDENESSRSRILVYLKREGASRIDIIADALALSKSTTRAHLLRLERMGQVQRHMLSQDGPGRPALCFSLSDEGSRRFPTSTRDVLAGMIRFLREQGNNQVIEDFFGNIWQERREELKEIAGDKLDALSLEERQEAILKLMTKHGFMPELRADDTEGNPEQFTLRACNCPFPAAVRETRIPCQLERAFLSEMMQRKMVHSRWATVPGRDTCDYVFDTEAPATVDASES